MKRSEFIRLSVLALVGTALPLPLPKLTQVNLKPKVKKYSMKVSNELLHDAKGFEIALNQVVKEKGKPDKIELGWENDDFAKNLQTLLLTYNK